MKELILAFLSRAYNMDTDSVADLLLKKSDDGTYTDELVDGALDALTRLDTERAGKLKGDGKTQFDNGFKKAQREVSEAWERKMRAKFELDQALTGDDLLEALAEKMTAGSAEMPDEQIRRSKLYRDLEKAAADRERSAQEQAEAKIQEIIAAQNRKEKLSSVHEKAKSWLLAKKPVLEANQLVADQRIADFLRELEQYDYDEDLTPLKDGEILKNQHQHPVKFDSLLEAIASRRFEFMTQDPKGNGGNKNDPGRSGATSLPPIPKTREEFERLYYDIPASDKDARTAFAKAYEESARNQ